MNDKELLRKIKNVRTAVKEIYGNVNTITYPMYMVDWLIKQAERVQRCQESYSGLDKMYDHWRNKAKELEKQLQQAQAKAERYEKALQEIVKYTGSDYTMVPYAIATKALEGKENE
jgi:predicted RNase H-like nuclease (RuvC/YqgF family)